MPTKRYWLRGGVIGLILSIAAVLLVFPLSLMNVGNWGNILRFFVTIIVDTNPIFWFANLVGGDPLFGLCSHSGEGGMICGIFAVLIYMPIWYFFVGAVAGYIYGKMKNRNRTVV